MFPASDQAEIAAAVTGMLASGALTLGPHTREFEAAFAAAHTGPRAPSPDGPHAVAVASGTAALTIALLALGVRGREVVVPANTFYATAAAVLQAGARPVFADVDAGTFALNATTTAAALTPRTAAVVAVHIGGLIPPQIDELRALCDERGIALVEDAAHAHGATFDGRFAGSFGAVAAFSFYPTKVVTSGEGGMVLTFSEELAQEARIYRDQGKGAFSANHHVRLGSAWRMSELHAATGLVHLRRMEEFIARRRAVAARYDKALADLDGLQPLAEPPGCRSNIYKYIALLPARPGPGTVQVGTGPAFPGKTVWRGLRSSAAPAAGAGGVRRPAASGGGRTGGQAYLPAGSFGHDRQRGGRGAGRRGRRPRRFRWEVSRGLRSDESRSLP